jgi:hypothetical protein
MNFHGKMILPDVLAGGANYHASNQATVEIIEMQKAFN